jgi:CheY-like chemotaxis protein
MIPVSELPAPAQPIRFIEPEVCGTLSRMNRIAIVEDKSVIRAGFEKLVGELDGCVCVGAFATAEEALRRLPPLQPDIVIMDIHLPQSLRHRMHRPAQGAVARGAHPDRDRL